MQLSEFFPASEVARDAEVRVTLGPAANRAHAVCYALDSATLRQANGNPNVAAIITTEALAAGVSTGKGCIVCTQPKLAFFTIHNRLFQAGALQPHSEEFIHPEAQIAPSVHLGKNVVIGRGVIIAQGAVIEDYSILGEETYVGPHCTIGARGLQNTQIAGRNFPVAYAGAVRVGARCEILAAAVIPKPYLCDFTELGNDVKVGSRASVGHGCQVGDSAIIGAASVVGGNSRIGHRVWLGPGVAVADGLTIGDDARVLIGSVAIANIPAGATVSGNFAFDHDKHLQNFTKLRHGR